MDGAERTAVITGAPWCAHCRGAWPVTPAGTFVMHLNVMRWRRPVCRGAGASIYPSFGAGVQVLRDG